MPSFHILIPSIGRPTLQRLINSLLPQLHECDHITIVFDDVEPMKITTEGAKCQIHIYRQTPNLGFWGHGIRNKYANKIERTEFVMHADDDDMYIEGVFDKLRLLCKRDDTLYIAKIIDCFGNIMPPGNYVKEGIINTACGIIPYDLNISAIWTRRFGGDGAFYQAIADQAKHVEFLDFAIYKSRDV